jgi:hypothetical protein
MRMAIESSPSPNSGLVTAWTFSEQSVVIKALSIAVVIQSLEAIAVGNQIK